MSKVVHKFKKGYSTLEFHTACGLFDQYNLFTRNGERIKYTDKKNRVTCKRCLAKIKKEKAK